jgi:hypothetical protein
VSGANPLSAIILDASLTEDQKVERLTSISRVGLDLFAFLPLYYAVRQNLPKVITQLFSLGLFPSRQEQGTGMTPLHYAVKHGYAQVAQILIAEHARQHRHVSWAIADNCGRTPLHYAAMFGNTELLEILLTDHANRYPGDCLLPPIFVNKKDNEGCTALHYAAIHDNDQAATVLLRQPNHNMNILDRQHRSALVCAIAGRCRKFIHVFMTQLDQFSHPSRLQSYCEISNALLTAAMQSSDELAELLDLGLSASGESLPRRNYPPLISLLNRILRPSQDGHNLDVIKQSVSRLMAAGAKINEPCLVVRVTAYSCEQDHSPSARELVLPKNTEEQCQLLALMEEYWAKKAIEYYAGFLFRLKVTAHPYTPLRVVQG